MELEQPLMLPRVAVKEEERFIQDENRTEKRTFYAEKTNSGTDIIISICRHRKKYHWSIS